LRHKHSVSRAHPWPWDGLRRRLASRVLRSMLGGWPLPTAGGQPWHCTKARPNRLSAVGSENTWKNRASYRTRSFQLPSRVFTL